MQRNAGMAFRDATSLTPLSPVVYKECAFPLFISMVGRLSYGCTRIP